MTTPIVPVAITDPLELLPDPSDLDTWPVRMAEMHRWMREDAAPQMSALGDASYANATAALEGAVAALAAGNYVGYWNSLTGALLKGNVVMHISRLWLLTVDLADVTASEPSSTNFDWKDFLTAGAIGFDGAAAGIEATTVQSAIEEMAKTQVPDNYITNGEMTSDGRGVSFAAVVDGQTTLDLWKVGKSNSAVLTVSKVQSWSHPLIGYQTREFRDAMRVEVTTADTTIAAGDVQIMYQRIVGRRARSLISVGFGFTLGFWYRSNKTGTHCAAVRNGGYTQSYVVEFSVPVAGVWKFYAFWINPTGIDMTDAGWNYDSGIGLEVDFTLANGTTRQTTPNAWQNGAYLSTANQVNVLDTVGNYIEVTGVRLYAGVVAGNYKYEDQAITRAKVSEWFRPNFRVLQNGLAANGVSVGIGVPISPPMAAAPTVTLVTDASGGAIGARTTAVTPSYFQVLAVGNASAAYSISYVVNLSCEL